MNTKIIDPEVKKLLDKFDKKRENLIPALQAIQYKFRYLSQDNIQAVANHLNIDKGKVLSVATFYTQFKFNPVGKYIIKVCHGTACHVNNAVSITNVIREYLKISDGETTKDKIFTLENVACLGCCSLAPVIMINDEVFGRLTPEKTIKIIKEYQRREEH